MAATPEDAAATTTLLRAPAAIVAAAFLVGVVAGEGVRSYRTPDPVTSALLCLAASLVCVPFLLSSNRYRPGGTWMRAWIWAAALTASIRTIDICVSLYPLRPSFGNWLMAAGLQVALLGTFWLAVFAVRRPTAVAEGARGAASDAP